MGGRLPRPNDNVADEAIVPIIAAAVASILNTVGGLLFNSRLLIINGLTCIANLVIAATNLYFYRKEMEPEDVDHPFGHAGYSLSASVFALLVYAFILGLGIDEVLNPRPYRVSSVAWTIPLVVAINYVIAVIYSRRLGGQFMTYSNLTTSEIAESLVALLVLPAAHYISFEIDRIGAVVMLTYLAYQIAVNSKDVLYNITGPAPSKSLYFNLYKEAESLGVSVYDLRLRRVGDRSVAGYMVIRVPSNESVAQAHAIADTIERAALEKYNVKLIVHVEPEGN